MRTERILEKRTYWVLSTRTYNFLQLFSLASFFLFLISWGLKLPKIITNISIPGFFMCALMEFFISEEKVQSSASEATET